MNHDSTTGAFQRLKPYCISLSAVSLSHPNASLPQLKDLRDVLLSVDQSCVSQNFANYIFFPLKPLLGPGVQEHITTAVFEVIRWLLRTGWFLKNEEMTTQLILLFTTKLAKADSEELKLSLIITCEELFCVAEECVNALQARPTLAHLTTVLLAESSSPEIRVASLRTLRALYLALDGDAGASFLPGTASSLSKTLVRANQKSVVLVAALHCLHASMSKCLDGSITSYRSQSWLSATKSQLILALNPVLSYLNKSEYTVVQEAAVNFCKSSLLQNCLSATIFVEFLLQTDAKAIPKQFDFIIAEIIESYIDASIRILQGVDEDRKISMLVTLKEAIPLLTQTSRQLLCTRFISQLMDFLTLAKDGHILLTLSDEEEPPEPKFEYLSNSAREALAGVLGSCEVNETFSFSTTEQFWIAQKMCLPTYSHAVANLRTQTDLAVRSIVREALQHGKDYRSELMNVLYPLLSLSSPSIYALKEISKACEYADVQEMIIDNADYIVNSLNLAFLTLNITPRTPKILGLLVQLAPLMVELVDDVIDTYLEVLDDYHGHSLLVEGIFSGLEGVINGVVKQEPPDSFKKAIAQAQPYSDPSFAERFEESAEQESSARTIDEEEVDRDSKSHMVVLRIMEKAQIFLSHPDDTIRFRVLDLIYAGIPVVATNEDKFLPLVHLYWPQLTRRFDDHNPFVVAATLRVISKTVTFAGSFMRMRINDDVLPFIKEILEPSKDKRGNLIKPRKGWEGTGRRKVADAIELTLKAIIEDGGLRDTEKSKAISIVQKLAVKSELLRAVLEQVTESDALR